MPGQSCIQSSFLNNYLYLTHEAHYLTHEAHYLTHVAHYLTHKAKPSVFIQPTAAQYKSQPKIYSTRTACHMTGCIQFVLEVVLSCMAVSSSRMLPWEEESTLRILSSISFSCFLLLAPSTIRLFFFSYKTEVWIQLHYIC